MKKFVLFALTLVAASTQAQENSDEACSSIHADTAKVFYTHPRNTGEAYIVNDENQMTILVNENVTTHIVMPEKITMVDLSTDRVVGNQCADNIVRIKPVEKMLNNELAGNITIIGERHIAQYRLVYSSSPIYAHSTFNVWQSEMKKYINPGISMTEQEMARYCWDMYTSKKKYHNINVNSNGIHAQVNNIYTVNDYFFIDFSLKNRTNIKYDIQEVRIKLTDKKQTKATNSQTIELSPVWSLNKTTSFKRSYRNILVIDKLTFPNEKMLTIEISENQISGRVINIPIEYSDVLNADGYDVTSE